MEYMALATGIRVVLLPGMTGSAIMEYSPSTKLLDNRLVTIVDDCLVKWKNIFNMINENKLIPKNISIM